MLDQNEPKALPPNLIPEMQTICDDYRLHLRTEIINNLNAAGVAYLNNVTSWTDIKAESNNQRLRDTIKQTPLYAVGEDDIAWNESINNFITLFNKNIPDQTVALTIENLKSTRVLDALYQKIDAIDQLKGKLSQATTLDKVSVALQEVKKPMEKRRDGSGQRFFDAINHLLKIFHIPPINTTLGVTGATQYTKLFDKVESAEKAATKETPQAPKPGRGSRE